ncbi:acyl-CoA thioesterase-1 [Psychrobacter sp. PL15]|uniref:arylesterase n=1 Tax=Psychrobacter sp. PL15 TaxID=3071719 RepID=UPI002DF8CDCA|nr:acyl-CoA thioesterase-1 [Psychrobacter sp. PL15]
MTSFSFSSILRSATQGSYHCVAAVLLLVTMVLSGCQKEPESADTQATNTQVATNQTTTETSTQAGQQQNSESLTILALGDSLTEGLGVASDENYPAQLQARLQELGYKNAKVINSGLSGETSTGLVNRLDWVLQTKPDITILTVGANDAIRGIDVATVDANIRTAVKRLQDNGSQVILGGMQIYDNLGSDYVQAFAAMYPKIAEDMNVTLIPFILEGVAADPKLNQADAIHPTSEGYTIIVNNNILPILKPELEQIKANQQDLSGPANTSANTKIATPTETTQ